MISHFRHGSRLRPTGLLTGLIAGLVGWAAVGGGVQTEAAQEPVAPVVEAAAEGAGKRVGRILQISLPITDDVTATVQRFADRALAEARLAAARPVLIFEFHVPPEKREIADSSRFGVSYDLARFLCGGKLNQATTVAYLPDSIAGHAVLVALACDVIVMGPNTEIGPAGIHEPAIGPDMFGNYREIAGRRQKIPAEVALGLLDSSRRVLVAETDISREYVSPRQLEELRKTRTIQSTRVLFEGGPPARLSVDEGRELDLVDFKAEDRNQLARYLELAPGRLREDYASGQGYRAVRVTVSGPITAETTRQAQLMIDESLRKQDANFVCLWIDSGGGSLADSLTLANYLADLGSRQVLTAAYVPAQARSDAALLALACDRVFLGPQATLGGEGERQPDRRDVETAIKPIRELAAHKSRNWSLPVAMIDPRLSVFRCTSPNAPGRHEFLSDEERAELPAANRWEKGEEVTSPDKPFEAAGKAAVEFGLAEDVVEGFEDFKRRFGLEQDPSLLEPNWAETLAQSLASPGLAVLLLIIGFAAFYAELHSPGIGVPGFVAAICFVLFFWSRFLGGTVGWLEVLLFVAGVCFVLMEIFVLPGFGIFGLGGGLMIIASLVLASQTFIIPHNAYQFAEFQHSILILAASIMGTVALAAFMHRWLPRSRMFGPIVLQPPEGEEAARLSRREALTHFDDLVGATGVATTPLIPGGKARFGDRLVDVISQGELIERGQSVMVLEVHGNRVLVCPTNVPT